MPGAGPVAAIAAAMGINPALLALPLLDMALDLYHGTPFEEYGMEPYTPQS